MAKGFTASPGLLRRKSRMNQNERACHLDICGIDIPKELNDALAAGKLVVFAGAGVSMQPPHGFRPFDQLVLSIGENVDPSGKCKGLMGNGESCEAALGRLADVGDVHEACASQLKDATCSDLHKNILRLFGRVDDIRMVTTNFDKRFEKAASEIDAKPRVYVAPALPKGGSFKGIVHLHGCIDWPEDMTLTDSDFGEAYVSEGRAARFLVDMFANYVVLFVGYSCSDMLVHYLARSVSTKVSGRVFALEKEETALRKWQHRGIEPIRYSDYSQLPQLLDQWSRKIRLSLFERVNTVQSIATHCRELDYELDEGARAEFAQLFNGPFASREELAALADAFVSGESGLRGLELLSSEGFDSFLYEDDYPSWQAPFFSWASNVLACGHAEELLAFSAKKCQHFSKRFCSNVFRALAANEASEECLAVWLAYFEPQWISSDGGGWYNLKSLFDRASNCNTALCLVRLAFSFEPEYQVGLLSQEGHMGVEFYFTSYGDDAGFGKAVLERSVDIGEQVFAFLIRQFEEIALIGSALGTKVAPFDGYSFSRSAIEEHEQDKGSNETIDTMISLARDLGADLFDRGVRRVDDFSRLVDSPACLVVRIGLFLLEHGKVDPDWAIDVVNRNKLFEQADARHEVFSLLRYSYPKATAESKGRLVGHICERYPNLDDRDDAYARFNIFQWLIMENASDSLLTARLREIAAKYPDFKVREHPDLIYCIRSSFPEEDQFANLREEDMSVDYFIDRHRATRDGFVRPHRDAVLFRPLKEYPDKAIEVCSDLLQRKDDARSLLAQALREVPWGSISTEKCQDAMDLLLKCFEDDSLYPSAVYAAKELSERKEFFACEGFDRIIAKALNEGNGWKSETWKLWDGGDWLTSSINCPIGWSFALLQKYAIHCERGNNDAGQKQVALWLDYAVNNSKDNSKYANCAAASLFSEANYWMQSQEAFFTTRVAPLLNCENGVHQGAWCGLGYLGYLSERLWKAVRPFWKSALFIEDDSDFGIESTRRVRKLFLWASIQHDDRARGRELFDFCANDPQTVSSAVRVLAEWVLRLSGDLSEKEWDEWVHSEMELLLDKKENFESAACHLGRLMNRQNVERAIVDDALRIVVAHSEWRCRRRLVDEELLPGLFDSPNITDEEKARFLIVQIESAKCLACFSDAFKSSLDLIDFSLVESRTKRRLRDLLALHRVEVPVALEGD